MTNVRLLNQVWLVISIIMMFGSSAGAIEGDAVEVRVLTPSFDVVIKDNPSAVGVSTSIVVTAKDLDGKLDSDYCGTVSFSTTDPDAFIPTTYSFFPEDAGIHTFETIKFMNIGIHSLTVTDVSRPYMFGSQKDITVEMSVDTATNAATAADSTAEDISHPSFRTGTIDVPTEATVKNDDNNAIAIEESDPICMKALEIMPKWSLGKFRNDDATLSEDLRDRFLVADLFLTDDYNNDKGKCKGVKEILPPEELRTEKMSEPMIIDPGKNGCSGQSISLCEIDGNIIKLVARFPVTSRRDNKNVKGYYAPVNYINTRHGDRRKANPTKDDRMGGGDERMLMYDGVDPMPNFMNFRPYSGFTGEKMNGIHRYPGGSRDYLGSPRSHGCIRTSDNGTRFIRDWTPVGAKFFFLHPSLKRPAQ